MVMVIGPVLTVTASKFRFTAFYAVILDYCDDPEPILTVTQTVRYNLASDSKRIRLPTECRNVLRLGLRANACRSVGASISRYLAHH